MLGLQAACTILWKIGEAVRDVLLLGFMCAPLILIHESIEIDWTDMRRRRTPATLQDVPRFLRLSPTLHSTTI